MRVIKSIAENGHNRFPAQYPQYGQTDMDTHFHSLVDILMGHANTQGYETAYVHWSPNQEIHQRISELHLLITSLKEFIWIFIPLRKT